MLRPRDGAIVKEDVPALSALNMRLRDDYVEDAAAGVARWNRVLERAGTPFRITLPHVAFNRRIGEFSAIHTDTEGNILSSEDWHARRESMLPSTEDNLFINSLMRSSLQAGDLRRLDRAAAAGHRQHAGRFRVRAAGELTHGSHSPWFAAILAGKPGSGRHDHRCRQANGTAGRDVRLAIADCDIHQSPKLGMKGLYPYLEKRWQDHLDMFGPLPRQAFEAGPAYPKSQPDASRRDAWPPERRPSRQRSGVHADAPSRSAQYHPRRAEHDPPASG